MRHTASGASRASAYGPSPIYGDRNVFLGRTVGQIPNWNVREYLIRIVRSSLIAQRAPEVEGIPIRDEGLVPDDVKIVSFAGIVTEAKVYDDLPVGVAVLDEPGG